MTFFSSEEHIKEWEQEHPELKGSAIGLQQGLGFIMTFGGGREDYDYAPLAPEQVNQALERWGFVGEFWKLPE
jgi:hypothetical protein